MMEASRHTRGMGGGVKAVVQGGLIGVANIIPGVSGGTLALMLGIYQRTIDAVCSINLELLRKVLGCLRGRKGAWPSLWSYAQTQGLVFLGWLGLGAVGGIVLFARVMGYILAHHRSPAYAFFGGLVLASIIFPWRCLRRRSWRELLSGVMAFVLTVGLSLAVSDQDRLEKEERKQRLEQADPAGGVIAAEREIGRMVLIGGAGALAVSAMILPGISGSFILLLLGVYFDILAAINQRDIILLVVFLAGIGIGLLVFTRFVSVLLSRAFNITMAFMIGLMAGSLYELWPFKGQAQVGGETVVLGNTVQGMGGADVLWAGVAFGVGLLLVAGFACWGGRGQGRVHPGDPVRGH